MYECLLNYYTDLLQACRLALDGAVAVTGEEWETEIRSLLKEHINSISGLASEMSNIHKGQITSFLKDFVAVSVAEVLGDCGEHELAEGVVELGMKTSPGSPALWKMKFACFVNTFTGTNTKEVLLELMGNALDKVFFSGKLFEDCYQSPEDRMCAKKEQTEFLSSMVDLFLSCNDMGMFSLEETVEFFSALILGKDAFGDKEVAMEFSRKLSRTSRFSEAWVEEYVLWLDNVNDAKLYLSLITSLFEKLKNKGDISPSIVNVIAASRVARGQAAEGFVNIYDDVKRLFDYLVMNHGLLVESWVSYVKFELEHNTSPALSVKKLLKLAF